MPLFVKNFDWSEKSDFEKYTLRFLPRFIPILVLTGVQKVNFT